VGDGGEDEVEHLGELGIGNEVFCGFEGHGVLKHRSRKNHALFLVAQEGDANKEDGQADLAILFVPGLLDVNGDVFFRGRVEEGENRTTCEEEAWEGEGVDVGTYHRWLVYNVKIRHILEDKKLNPVFFGNYFSGHRPKEIPEVFDLHIFLNWPGFFQAGLGLPWAWGGPALGWPGLGWPGLGPKKIPG
jgi:hypothetical protein